MARSGRCCVEFLGIAARPFPTRARSGAAFATVVFALGLGACSPALNWRSVALGDATVTLPCKPDRAQRAVQLGGAPLAMEMVGCEADGALFAVSRISLPAAADAAALQAQWQAASLLQMRAQASPTVSDVQNTGPKALPLRVLSAAGQRADGQPVQARLAWVAVGTDLFHLAVYAPRTTPDMTDPFFDGIKAP